MAKKYKQKKRLNRKVFKDESVSAFEVFNEYSGLGGLIKKNRYLYTAILAVATTSMTEDKTITSEQIGACKVMKIAAELERKEHEFTNLDGSYNYDRAIDEVVQSILEL